MRNFSEDVTKSRLFSRRAKIQQQGSPEFLSPIVRRKINFSLSFFFVQFFLGLMVFWEAIIIIIMQFTLFYTLHYTLRILSGIIDPTLLHFGA